MKNLLQHRPSIMKFAAIMASLFVMTTACELETPLDSLDLSSPEAIQDLLDQAGITGDQEYPQTVSYDVVFNGDQLYYPGGAFILPQGTGFYLPDSAFTPPDSLVGQTVTVSMTVELDSVKNELMYTFGPSGTAFSPPAQVWFNFRDLGVDSVSVFHVNAAGEYIEQTIDEIDNNLKVAKVKLHHFSRYAVAHSL